MAGTAADLFFWNDWQGDPTLRLCSLAAQGLWMRLLCIAAESTKKGFVLINGQKPTLAQIAKVAGAGPAEVQKLQQELEQNGVYSRDAQGVIYSRRMVLAEKKRAASSKGGKIGGKATLGKKKGIFNTQGGTQGGTQPPIPIPVSDTSTDTNNSSLRSEEAALLKAMGGIEIPDWVPVEPWKAFVEMRRTKAQAPGKARVPFTVAAAKAAITKLEKLRAAGEDMTAVLEQTVLEGWSGVFPVHADRGGARAGTTAAGGNGSDYFKSGRILRIVEGGGGAGS